MVLAERLEDITHEQLMREITGMTSGVFYELLSLRSRGANDKARKSMSEAEKKAYNKNRLPAFIEHACYMKYKD